MADPITIAVLTAAATGVQAFGQFQQGIQQNRLAKYQANQLEVKAGQERAAAQRMAAEERRNSNIVQSNALAAAAASGASASDPGAVGVISKIAGEGAYRSLVQGYQGEVDAWNSLNQAQATRFEGKEAARAGRIGAMTTIMSGASSLYSKYNPAGSTQAASGMGYSPGRATTTMQSGQSIRWNR